MKAGNLFARLMTKRLMVAVLLLCIFFMAAREVTNTDVWWHLATGKHICETRSVPREDIYSHTASGKRWIDHSWLSQVIIYLTYRGFGFGGLAFLAAAVITLVFLLAFLGSSGHLYTRIFATLLGALTSAVTWEMRPHIFSFLFVALFVFILLLHRQRRGNYLFVLPVLMLLWANSHSGYVAGLILVGILLVGEGAKHLLGWGSARMEVRRWKELLIWGSVCLVVIAINPNTLRLYLYPLETASIGPLKYLSEWASPNFHSLQFHPFIWMLLVSILTLGLAAKRLDLTDLLYVVVFGYMSLLAARNISLFALVAIPVVSKYGSVAWRSWRGGEQPSRALRPQRWRVALNWSILLVILVGCVAKAWLTFTPQANLAAQKRALPHDAADFLAQNAVPRELFNSYNWGGYLIWRLYPEYRVFIDGRTHLYGEEILEQYLAAYWGSPEWREPLEIYGINSVIIERDGSFATVLTESPSWEQVYADELAAVFVRR